MRRLLFTLFFLIAIAETVWHAVPAQSAPEKGLPSLLYTSAPTYAGEAWLRGGERFPAGAQVLSFAGGKSRAWVGGFAATADAAVSFDGARVLFAGKKQLKDSWQIWEVAVLGGEAKKITKCAGDCVRPFYLPGGRLVYSEKIQGRFVLQGAPLDGGPALPLSYAPGNAVPTDVLRDGRILFEAAYPMGSGTRPEIYTVYSDGSGVESYRCDHGARRQAGKQNATGDIVFASETGLARFTSALGKEVAMSVPAGDFAGDVTSVTAGTYVVVWRPDEKTRWSLNEWDAATNSLMPIVAANDADLIQPVLVQPRPVPNQHPSGLHEWSYANLLCLNTYTTKDKIAAGSVVAAKLYTTDEKGKSRSLGQSSVEADGSFYVQVPGDQPLQIELLDAHGKTVLRERGWWWMRKGEQRICVGCHAGPERAPENAVPAVLVKSVRPVVMK